MAVTSTTSSSASPALSSPGIGSGLDVASIVSKLMAVEQQPMTELQTKATSYQSTISALGSIKGALSAFQSAVQKLATPSALTSLKASSGATSIVAASIGTGAVAGSYAVEVSQLAQAQKLASNGFANATDVIGTGTLTFEFGTTAGATFTASGAASKTVTIGAGQSTLSGVRDAVNAANIGVTATIVNDGSASGNRLVFTSASSGAASSLRIGVADDDGSSTDASGLSQLAYDPSGTAGAGKNLTEKVAAQDALLTIDGIAVAKPSNTISDAIQGVTLNLLAKNVGTPATVSVASDTTGVAQAVQAFVSSFNSLHDTVASLTKYDPTTKAGSVLTGDSTVRLIQTQLRNVLGNTVTGLPSSLNTLAQAGISLQADGTLSVDSTKLAAAVASNPQGIVDLFAAQGHATDSLIGVSAGTATKPGTYAVSVTQLATQGTLAGASAAGLTISAGVNDALSVTVDGVAVSVTLDAGTYDSADALASQVQAKINGASALSTAGSSVTVRQTGGVLSIVSNRYGSASNVAVSGAGASSLLGASPTASAGIDVAGTINGVAALGSGQKLMGATGTVVDGLALTIQGGTLGGRGSVTYSQGYGSALDNVIKPMLATDGLIASRTDGLNASIKDVQRREDVLQVRLDALQKQYTAQFSALDTMLASMQQTSTYLTQQLANLPTPGKTSA